MMSRRLDGAHDAGWPQLPLAEWADTAATLHMWTQIAGKIRMALSPPVNHWWHVPLYVAPRGLTTSPIPHAARLFEMEFDFIDHQLAIRTNRGESRHVPLYARSVADFYGELLEVLRAIEIEVEIWPVPVEVPDPIAFPEDAIHAAYDPEAVSRFHRILLSVDTLLKGFRGEFLGKASPVHFFWGSFDLAVTRFSGRRAPEREGTDAMNREAYSHECSSAGFWPGSGPVTDAAFYSYTTPAPDGFRDYPVRPSSAYYHPDLNEYLLPYEEVRNSPSPEATLREFLQSTYEAGASLGNWDRAALERPRPGPERSR